MPGTQWGQGRPDHEMHEIGYVESSDGHSPVADDLDKTVAINDLFGLNPDNDWTADHPDDHSHYHSGLGYHRHMNGHIDHMHAAGGPIIHDRSN